MDARRINRFVEGAKSHRMNGNAGQFDSNLSVTVAVKKLDAISDVQALDNYWGECAGAEQHTNGRETWQRGFDWS